MCCVLLGISSVLARRQENYHPTGYRGFAEVGGVINMGSTFDHPYVMATTTHGYQIAPWIFVGGGMGFVVCLDRDFVDAIGENSYSFVPLYGALRFNFKQKRVSPLADIKMGYAFNNVDDGGIYGQFAFGATYAVREEYSIYVSGGYQFINAWLPYDTHVWMDGECRARGFAITFGIEF